MNIHRAFYVNVKEILIWVIPTVLIVIGSVMFLTKTPCQRFVFQKVAQMFYNYGMKGLDHNNNKIACE